MGLWSYLKKANLKYRLYQEAHPDPGKERFHRKMEKVFGKRTYFVIFGNRFSSKRK